MHAGFVARGAYCPSIATPLGLSLFGPPPLSIDTAAPVGEVEKAPNLKNRLRATREPVVKGSLRQL